MLYVKSIKWTPLKDNWLVPQCQRYYAVKWDSPSLHKNKQIFEPVFFYQAWNSSLSSRGFEV